MAHQHDLIKVSEESIQPNTNTTTDTLKNSSKIYENNTNNESPDDNVLENELDEIIKNSIVPDQLLALQRNEVDTIEGNIKHFVELSAKYELVSFKESNQCSNEDLLKEHTVGSIENASEDLNAEEILEQAKLDSFKIRLNSFDVDSTNWTNNSNIMFHTRFSLMIFSIWGKYIFTAYFGNANMQRF